MAGSAKGVRAGKAFVEFYADSSPFVRSLKHMSAEAKQWGATVASIGTKVAATFGGAMATLTAASNSFASSGNEMAKLSQRTGASVEALSALKYAAEQSGTSIETIGGVMSKVRDDIAGVAAGNFDLANSYAKLGVSMNQLASMKPEDQFALLLDRVSRIRNPIMQAAAANEIFGSSAEELLPMIQKGSKGLAEATQRAEELGIVMSGDAAKSGEMLHVALNGIRDAAYGLWKQIGAALAPTITELATVAATYIGRASKWIASNRELIVTIAKGVAVATAIGVALVAAGGAMVSFGVVAGAVASAVAGISAIMSALISTTGLIIAALSAGAVAFFGFTDAGQSAMSAILQSAYDLYSRFTDYWKGIVDAVMSGDLELAGQIAMLAIQVEFTRWLEFIKSLWRGASTYALDAWDWATTEIAVVIANLSSEIGGIWTTLVDGLDMAWSLAFAGMAKAVATFVQAVTGMLKPVVDTIAKVTGTDYSMVLNAASAGANVVASSFSREAGLKTASFAANASGKAIAREEDRAATEQAIRDDSAARVSGRAASDEAAFAEGQSEIARLQGELAKLVGEASSNAASAKLDSPDGTKRKAGVSSSGFDFGAAKQSISGSFSAASAARISGTGDPQYRELQSINRGIQTLVNNGMKFT